MNIVIERKINELTKEEFRFWFYDGRGILYLDAYKFMQRTTTTHKFQTTKQYSRLDRQVPPYNWIKLEDVPLNEEIKKLALQKFSSEIKVDVWVER